MYKKDDCEIRMNMLGMSSEVLLVQLQACEGAEGSQHPEQSLSCLVWVPAGPWGAAPPLGVAGCRGGGSGCAAAPDPAHHCPGEQPCGWWQAFHRHNTEDNYVAVNKWWWLHSLTLKHHPGYFDLPFFFKLCHQKRPDHLAQSQLTMPEMWLTLVPQ